MMMCHIQCDYGGVCSYESGETSDEYLNEKKCLKLCFVLTFLDRLAE